MTIYDYKWITISWSKETLQGMTLVIQLQLCARHYRAVSTKALRETIAGTQSMRALCYGPIMRTLCYDPIMRTLCYGPIDRLSATARSTSTLGIEASLDGRARRVALLQALVHVVDLLRVRFGDLASLAGRHARRDGLDVPLAPTVHRVVHEAVEVVLGIAAVDVAHALVVGADIRVRGCTKSVISF